MYERIRCVRAAYVSHTCGCECDACVEKVVAFRFLDQLLLFSLKVVLRLFLLVFVPFPIHSPSGPMHNDDAMALDLRCEDKCVSEQGVVVLAVVTVEMINT